MTIEFAKELAIMACAQEWQTNPEEFWVKSAEMLEDGTICCAVYQDEMFWENMYVDDECVSFDGGDCNIEYPIETLADDFRTLYEEFMDKYGVYGRLWSQAFENYSRYMFCEKNREYICEMYRETERIVSMAKHRGQAYYIGLDEFLKEYKSAVTNYMNEQN